jgi:hypothetical protein
MIPSHPLQARFLALLPRIESRARFHFRSVKCPDQRADRIAEAVALAWQWFLSLEQRGKDVTQFVTVFATLASRAARSGRRVAGMEQAKDVLSFRAQERGAFTLTSLSGSSPLLDNVLDDAVSDNTQTPPPDAAAFRIDFPRWLATLSERDQRMAHDLMMGGGTFPVARKFGVSPARVSQLRQRFHRDWQRFHGEVDCQAA